MQNSIWKLAALAGVVGVVFLVLLQANHRLSKDGADAFRPPYEEPGGADGSHKPSVEVDAAAFEASPPFDQAEPVADSVAAKTAQAEPALASSTEPRPATNPPSAAGPGFDFGGSFERTPRAGTATPSLRPEPELEPIPKRTAARSEPAGFDPFEADPQPVPQPKPQPAPTTDPAELARSANELLRQARQDLESGRMAEARSKARQAQQLDVAYGLVDDRPELVLAAVDRMERAQRGERTMNVADVDPGAVGSASAPQFASSQDTGEARGTRILAAAPKAASPIATVSGESTGAPEPNSTAAFDEFAPFDDEAPPRTVRPKTVVAASGSGPQLFAPGSEPNPTPKPTAEAPGPRTAAIAPSGTGGQAASGTRPDAAGPLADDDPFGTPAPRPMPAPKSPPTFPAVEEDPFGETAPASAAPPKTAPAGATGPQISPRGGELAVPSKSASPFPALDAEPSPFADEPPAATAPRTRELPRVPLDSPQPMPVFGDEPTRLSPPTNAAELNPPPQPNSTGAADDLRGDATVGTTAPSGEQRPQLKIEKVAPENAIIGQPLIYSILVSNVGKSAAAKVVVEDQVPKGAELTGTIPRAEMIGKRLVWRLGTLEPGEQRKIAVRVTPVSEGEIGSIATVNFVTEVASRTLITSPKLEFALRGPQQAKVGEAIVYVFDLKNVGTGDATGVMIRNLIPDGLRHADGNDLEYEVGTLPAGESREVKLTVTTVRSGKASNVAIASADGDIQVESRSDLLVAAPAGLSLARTGPGKSYLGRAATFANAVTNDTTAPLAGLMVVEHVPEGVEFAEASDGGQYNAAKRTVAWRLDRLGPRESRVVQVKLVPKKVGALSSTVRAYDGQGTTTETAARIEVLGYAAVGVDVSGGEAPAVVGERFPLKITARNRGTTAATNVQVSLVVPAELKFVSAEGARYRQQGDRIEFEPVETLHGEGQIAIEAVFEAQRTADVRVRVAVQADQMRPLAQETAVLVVDGPK